jgi:hypothetical protein
MDFRPWTLLLGQIIAAGGVKRVPAAISWPMHAALKEMHDRASRGGLLAGLPVELHFVAAPESGMRAQGADEALSDLCQSGIVQRAGRLSGATLDVDDQLIVPIRRTLLELDPETVRLLQRTGSRWAALASTALKNAPTPARSPRSTVASAIDSRHDFFPTLR